MAEYKNTASLTFNSIKKISNTVIYNLSDSLSFTKTIIGTTYKPDGKITNIININNSSDKSYSGLYIIDDLGSYKYGTHNYNPMEFIYFSEKYYRNGERVKSPEIGWGAYLKFQKINLLPHENAMLVYQVGLTKYASYDIINGTPSSIMNTTTLSGTDLEDPLSSSVTITAADFTNVSLTKLLVNDTVVQNGKITYKFILNNYGNIPVETDAVLSDIFKQKIEITNVEFNDRRWNEMIDYRYNQATDEFISLDNKITIPAASYERNPSLNQKITTTPGTSTLVVTGILL